jgi:hydroxyacylglutathione hydrolase
MDIERIVTAGLGNASHLIASGGEAAVIDPPRDAWRVSALAEARGWRVTHVLETHVHNDYLSGALELRSSSGARIVAPARGRYAFDHRGVEAGDTVALGDLTLTARATPGHTPEHIAWEVAERGAARPGAVLTGGSLMVGGAGRTDLLGVDRMDALARDQYRSLQTLAALPDDAVVLPTHGAGSFCGSGGGDGRRDSTIGRERATNPLLRSATEDAFVRELVGGLGPYPTYYAAMAPINRAGPPVLGRAPRPPLIDVDGFAAALAGGARIVDARPRADVAAGHIPGSLAVELGDSFASYVGWFVPFGTPIVLVLPETAPDALAEAAVALWRIGYDRVVGALRGGPAAWADADRPLATYPLVTIPELRAEDPAERGVLLDVRDPAEWRDEGTVPGALTIASGELEGGIGELPRDRRITVMCKSGQRASIAASLLDAAGFEVRLVGVGGVPDWDRGAALSPGAGSG